MPSVGRVTLGGRAFPITGGVQAEAGWPISKEAAEKILSQEGG